MAAMMNTYISKKVANNTLNLVKHHYMPSPALHLATLHPAGSVPVDEVLGYKSKILVLCMLERHYKEREAEKDRDEGEEKCSRERREDEWKVDRYIEKENT